MKNPEMAVTLSKSEQVSQALWSLMAREKMSPGDQIPTENALTKHLNVSRVTVRKALCNMAEQGVLIRKKGKGSFLSEQFSLSEAMDKQSQNVSRKFTVGIVLSALNDDYFRIIASACEQELDIAGIKTIFWAANSIAEAEKYMQNFKLLDGLIISPADTDFPAVLQQKLPHLPMIFVNETMPGEIDCITSDDYNGAYQTIKYLHSLGHQRIAHIHGPLNTTTGMSRHKGYLEAMQDCGLSKYIQEEGATGYSHKTGYEAMQHLLEKDLAPEAVFCANDDVATGAYAAVKEAGLQIPDDISMVGYGNQRCGIELCPQLTTIDQHPDLIGSIAAEHLLRYLYGYTYRPCDIKVPASLIFRKSCAVPPRCRK